MLVAEGGVLLKFWIHLSKKDQKRRLERLEEDPRTRWRVTRRDWEAWRLHNKSHDLWELVLRESSSGEAPWCVVEGTDDHIGISPSAGFCSTRCDRRSRPKAPRRRVPSRPRRHRSSTTSG
jgi:hypothetical protein